MPGMSTRGPSIQLAVTLMARSGQLAHAFRTLSSSSAGTVSNPTLTFAYPSSSISKTSFAKNMQRACPWQRLGSTKTFIFSGLAISEFQRQRADAVPLLGGISGAKLGYDPQEFFDANEELPAPQV